MTRDESLTSGVQLEFIWPSWCSGLRLELEDPLLLCMSVLNNALGEPESNLFLSAFDSVRAVADVTADSESVIATDRTDWRLQGVGSTKHSTASLDSIQTLPNHGYNGSRCHVLDETREEGFSFQVSIMLLEVLWSCLNELERDQLEAALFKSTDDLSDEGTMDTIRLDHDVGAFLDRHVELVVVGERKECRQILCKCEGGL